MKIFINVIQALFCLITGIYIITVASRLNYQEKSIKQLEKEVKELQNQYYNLYNSHNYVLRQVEDMKQF